VALKTEHDTGYESGFADDTDKALWSCQAHIDRLEPGKNIKTREALLDLEASIRSNLISIRAKII